MTAVIFGTLSICFGIGVGFFSPSLGLIVTVSIIGTGVIYVLGKK